MSSRRSRALAARFAVGAILVGGCIHGGRDAPTPTSSLAPDTIGVIVAWDEAGCRHRREYTLDTGEIVVVTHSDGRCGASEYARTTHLEYSGFGNLDRPGPVEDGDLILLAMNGAEVAWVVAARAVPDDPDCSYELQGFSFDLGHALHFASGLVLPKAQDYEVEPDWIEKPWEVLPRSEATYCLDVAGAVTRVRIPPQY